MIQRQYNIFNPQTRQYVTDDGVSSVSDEAKPLTEEIAKGRLVELGPGWIIVETFESIHNREDNEQE